MTSSVSLLLCLNLLLLTAAKRIGREGNEVESSDSKQFQLSDDIRTPEQNPALHEMLDLDRAQRLSRGAEDDEQQSTFGHSFENEWVTSPQVTEFSIKVDPETQNYSRGEDPHLRANSTSLYNPFYPLVDDTYSAYAVLVLGSLLLAVGVVSNMALMCIVWNNYYMRSGWNYLLASIAFWDFLVLVVCLPVVVLNHLSHRRILGDITCQMVPYMEIVSLGITSFTLCALGIDRFHAATSSPQPKARRVERCRSVLLKLLPVWLSALLLSSPEIFLWELSQTVSPSSGRTLDSCTITPHSALSLVLPDSLHSLLLRYHQGRMWWCFGCYFGLPVLFTILCQMATRNVNSDSSSAQKQRSLDDRANIQKRQQHQAVEQQLNCTLLALAVVYGLCALPEHVCNITLVYTHLSVSEGTAAILALLHHFLLFLKCVVTPILLLCMCKALGQAFMDCCCCCCQDCQTASEEGSRGSAQVKLKDPNETSIFFDKAKDTSAILSISS